MVKRRIVKGSAPCKQISSEERPSTAVTPGWRSENWSGYAIRKTKKGAFHSISAYWIVPRVRPSQKNKYSSAWIGIDGFSNSSLIQTGTEQDYENGKAVYYAWWEILPAAETRIPYPVSPGDLMYARISKLRRSNWLILLANKTKGWVFRKVKTYKGPATSAEWIMEAASLDDKTAKLANYGNIVFNKCRINNRNPMLKPSYRGVMIQNNRVVSIPSLPDKDRDGFSIAYGSKMPSPPSSTFIRM